MKWGVNSMENTLSGVLGKPADYKICSGCSVINWYENNECHNCRSQQFDEDKQKVIVSILNKIESYEDEGYSESEADEILTDI